MFVICHHEKIGETLIFSSLHPPPANPSSMLLDIVSHITGSFII